jgi:hypothetical protein
VLRELAGGPEPAVSSELTINDAVLAGNDLVVGGVVRRQGVVWTIPVG